MLISAFAIHTGGGAALLDALLVAIGGKPCRLIADSRYRGPIPPRIKVDRVPPRVFARLVMLWRLGGMEPEETLLCFNGLPPLRRRRGRGRTIAFIQAQYLVSCQDDAVHPFRIRLRFWIERLLFRLGRRNLDEIWVQTETMAASARAIARGVPVRVRPFAPGVPALARVPGEAFVYPADAAAHKNHARLLEAWAMLDREGLRAPLLLTISAADLGKVLRAAKLAPLPHVVACGVLPRAHLLGLLARCRALIFPSLTESFGLPLIEAGQLGVPILASDRLFVTDVCSPALSFDPLDPQAIARTIKNFLACGAAVSPPPSFPTGADFLVALNDPLCRSIGPPSDNEAAGNRG